MTAIVEIPVGHFSGQRAIPSRPGGADTRSLEDLIRELQQAVNGGSLAGFTDDQRTAATEDRTAFIAPADGEIAYVGAFNAAAAAAGESMAIDVEIGGTTCLTGAITLDDGDGTDVVEGTLDTAAVAFSQGDKVVITRTYTAGGGPTPITGNSVTVGCRFSE